MANFLAALAIIVAALIPLCGLAYYREKQYNRLLNVMMFGIIGATFIYMIFMIGYVTGASRAFSYSRDKPAGMEFDWYPIGGDPFSALIFPLALMAALPAIPSLVRWVKAADEDTPPSNDTHS